MDYKMITPVPDVSVIIPVYNAEKYLRQTLEYLVHQTLPSIEFIFIEDGSTDNSMNILKEYQKKYQDKIFIYQTSNVGPGEARNVGIAHARADFIGFADADDYMEYDMYEKMFEETKKQSCDMVYIPYYLVRGSKKKVMGRIPQPLSQEQMIFYGEVSFWTKLIHKDLLKRAGKIPAMWFEDTAYMLVVFSYAEHVVYLNEPLYYYMKREGSITDSMKDPKTLDTIQAENYALKHCCQSFRKAVAARVADRILFNLKRRWVYTKEFAQHLKSHRQDIVGNEILQGYPSRYAQIINYLEMSDEPIPHTVFVSGFGRKVNENWLKSFSDKVFSDSCQLAVLDESSCAIDCNPTVQQAYNEGNYEYVSAYFVVKNLYERGGIYLDTRLHISRSFDFLCTFSSFFGFLDQNSFTDRVFGCKPHDSIMKEILQTYEHKEFYLDEFLPLGQRIRNILTAYAGVALDNQTHLADYSCAVFDSSVFVLKGENSMHLCSHDFCENLLDSEYTILPKSTVYALTISKQTEAMEKVYGELDRVTTLKDKLIMQRTQLRAEKKQLNKEKKQLREKIEEYENSTSWKVTKPLRNGTAAVKGIMHRK